MSEQLSQRDVEALRVTVHALQGTLDKLDTTITKFQDSVERTYVRRDVIEPKMERMQEQINGHDNWLVWAQRLLIGAVMLALLGLVITGKS